MNFLNSVDKLKYSIAFIEFYKYDFFFANEDNKKATKKLICNSFDHCPNFQLHPQQQIAWETIASKYFSPANGKIDIFLWSAGGEKRHLGECKY